MRHIRGLLHLSFVALYLLSSYATTECRVDYIGTELQHSNSHSRDVNIGHSCKDRIPYTQFREAKKAGIDFAFHPRLELTFAPEVTIRRFWLSEFAVRPLVDLEVSHSRAPPSLL
jgi:hypothetical protein